MKHPLTSKERRGLVAVAAAALLCIASGFIFRNCHFLNNSDDSHSDKIAVDSISSDDSNSNEIAVDSISSEIGKDSILKSLKANPDADDKQKSGGKYKGDGSRKKKDAKSGKGCGGKSKSKKKKRPAKIYPSRDPLSQPCD